MRFRDRTHAGQALAAKLGHYTNRPDVVVLGLPRGGVIVAAEVARALDAPLDIFVVRKLGMPGHEELAIGAIATGGIRVLNYHVVQTYDITPPTIEAVAAQEGAELARRESLYRGDRPPLDVNGWTVIVVDDGMATGATMRAAVSALESLGPASRIVAVPVASATACQDVGVMVDDIQCLHAPVDFAAVGEFYESFGQTTDDEVRQALAASKRL
jgi:putative phosphoribosyl transferase